MPNDHGYKIPMQRPASGCNNCGGPVRTYKDSYYGWTCAVCVREDKQKIAARYPAIC